MNIKVAQTQDEKEQAFNLRREVFIKEQHVPPDEEIDSFDENSTHLIGYENNDPIAAGRIRFDNQSGHLERICVQKDKRGESYGSQMIRAMESIIQKAGYTKAELNAQTQAISFYKKQGYGIVSDEFMDAGILHVTMNKHLTNQVSS